MSLNLWQNSLSASPPNRNLSHSVWARRVISRQTFSVKAFSITSSRSERSDLKGNWNWRRERL